MCGWPVQSMSCPVTYEPSYRFRHHIDAGSTVIISCLARMTSHEPQFPSCPPTLQSYRVTSPPKSSAGQDSLPISNPRCLPDSHSTRLPSVLDIFLIPNHPILRQGRAGHGGVGSGNVLLLLLSFSLFFLSLWFTPPSFPSLLGSHFYLILKHFQSFKHVLRAFPSSGPSVTSMLLGLFFLLFFLLSLLLRSLYGYLILYLLIDSHVHLLSHIGLARTLPTDTRLLFRPWEEERKRGEERREHRGQREKEKSTEEEKTRRCVSEHRLPSPFTLTYIRWQDCAWGRPRSQMVNEEDVT